MADLIPVPELNEDDVELGRRQQPKAAEAVAPPNIASRPSSSSSEQPRVVANGRQPAQQPAPADISAPVVKMEEAKNDTGPNISTPATKPTLSPNAKPLNGVPQERADAQAQGKIIPGTYHTDPKTGQEVVTPYSIAERVNPMAGVFAHSENIHNPVLRTLARIATGIGTFAQGAADVADPEQAKLRLAEIGAPGAQAEQATKIRLQNAQANEADAKAKGASQEEKVEEEAAAHDLFPVRQPDGSISFQKAERNLSGEEFAKLTPDQQYGYASYQASSATDPTQKAQWQQRADAAKEAVNLKQPTAADQQPASADRIKQVVDEISGLQALSEAERKKYAPLAGATSGAVEKQLADARAQSDQNLKKQEQDTNQGNKLTKDKVDKLRPVIQKDYDSTSSQIDKLDQAKTELASGNAGQAIGVVKTLSGLASGAGSGVRITGAELQLLIHNTRGTAGDLSAAWNKIVGGENIVLNKDQITSLNGLVDHVKTHLNLKRDVADYTLHSLDTATSKEEAVKASDDFRRYAKAIEQNKAYTRSSLESYAAKTKQSPEDVEKAFKKEGGVEIPQ